ncbi:Uncharacterised protein [Mycobacteroides abscessus subsp. abscessus]|nr:Uncharacterised protein [Mycobacteroides abscessus subsp. abscessus]
MNIPSSGLGLYPTLLCEMRDLAEVQLRRAPVRKRGLPLTAANVTRDGVLGPRVMRSAGVLNSNRDTLTDS